MVSGWVPRKENRGNKKLMRKLSKEIVKKILVLHSQGKSERAIALVGR